MKNKMIIRALSLFITLNILISQFPMTSYAETSKNSNNRIIVSMGDSYSSGEGVESFYCQNISDERKAVNNDFLAHRSEKSWPGNLKLNGKSLSKQKDTNWFFVASSGAETKHFNNKQKKSYKRNNIDKTTYLSSQLSVFDQFEKNEVDYVTMTIGGNDVGFSDIITKAVIEGNSFLSPVLVADKLNKAWKDFYSKGGAKENIRQAYLDVRNASGKDTNIIVAGYPKLIASVPLSQPYFSIDEALLINNSVSKFNKEINSIVDELTKKDENIYFVSVEEAFSGHEAYSINSYINGIMLNRSQDLKELDKSDIAGTLVSAYSMHPNDKGTVAYANCVQKVIDKIETKNKNIYDKQSSTTNSNTFIDQLCSSQWYMINGYYYDGGPSDVVYSFTEDGYAIEQGLRGPDTPSKFKYNIINDTCISFSYDNNDFNYTIYQTESENVLRYKAKIYGDDREGLLVKTEDKNNSESILNILAGGCWYSEYHEKKHTMNMVRANGDGHYNTTLDFGFFPESYVEGYTLYGNGITDYLALFVPSEYVNSGKFIFVEYNGEVDVNAYIFDEGEFIFEKWESYYSDGY